jgi:metacaspase-1
VKNPNRIKTLQETRYALRQSDYTQVPQLSVGLEMNLNQALCL